MAQWDDILRATLKTAGKLSDEIEEIVAKVAKSVDGGTPKVAAETAGTEKTVGAAELAKMSKAERAAYNASKNVTDKAAAEAGQKLSRADKKLANVKETEDIINKTMTEPMKNQFGKAGLATQINKMYGAGFDVSENAILKRVESEVYKAVSEAKDAGSPLSRDQVKELISAKTKEVTEQMTKAAEGSKKATETRIKNINELSPEEARMSGVKTALITQAAKAEKAGDAESLLSRLTRLAKDENLLPVLDDEGKQVTFEVVVDGKKVNLPRYETRAERSLRITKEKEFKAKDVSDGGDGTTKPPKTADEKLNEAVTKQYEVTDSSAKLLAAQEEGIIRAAKEAAESSESPAAKDALARITKEYNRGTKTKEEYLAFLKGIPRITGDVVTDADMAKLEEASKAAKVAKAQRDAEQVAELEKKYGKGYTTEPGESGTIVYKPASVPKSELKGRKWIRDASGKLVLVKK